MAVACIAACRINSSKIGGRFHARRNTSLEVKKRNKRNREGNPEELHLAGNYNQTRVQFDLNETNQDERSSVSMAYVVEVSASAYEK